MEKLTIVTIKDGVRTEFQIEQDTTVIWQFDYNGQPIIDFGMTIGSLWTKLNKESLDQARASDPEKYPGK